MNLPADLSQSVLENWPVWLVTITLVVAAIIDGKQLRVPNWITFPMVLTGLVYNTIHLGLPGLGYSLLGMVVGLAVLLPAYAIGGMGAGDVKLMAGVGAWLGASITFFAFCASAIIGGVMAIVMVLVARAWNKHHQQFWMLLFEMKTIRNPTELATIAAERKSTMMLLPYGIPMAIGSILYFAWAGLLF